VETVGVDDSDFMRLKNDLVAALQTQTDLRPAFSLFFHCTHSLEQQQYEWVIGNLVFGARFSTISLI